MSKEPPDNILNELLDGNQRWIIGLSQIYISEEATFSYEYTGGQTPTAVIITCADSRVIPEFIFDQGLGSLFVIRVAGNVISPTVVASVEYALEELDVGIVMILGHQKCGAVGAKLQLQDQKHEAHLSKSMQELIDLIEVTESHNSVDTTPDVITNLIEQSHRLKSASQILRKRIKSKQTRFINALYWIDNRRVDIINQKGEVDKTRDQLVSQHIWSSLR